MGRSSRKTKEFIDRKKAATFRLVYADTAECTSSGDRVFTRVDAGTNYIPGFTDDDPYTERWSESDAQHGNEQGQGPLPEHIRREIMELGLPDDGYNYLLHLRDIKSTSSAFVAAPVQSYRSNSLPADVKAYDASKVQVTPSEEEASNFRELNAISSSTCFMKNVRRAIDPEVLACLEKSDDSDVDSSDEGLEEDFVIQANTEDEDTQIFNTLECAKTVICSREDGRTDAGQVKELHESRDHAESLHRTPRPLDEQFELLALREYADGVDIDEFPLYDEDAVGSKDFKAPEINSAMKEFLINQSKYEDKYFGPGDRSLENTQTDSVCNVESAENCTEFESAPTSDVISKCRGYAESYANNSEDGKETMLVENSSDESEAWDCETIVSTYSNLDNHPAKIGAPSNFGKRVISGNFERSPSADGSTICLRGKQQIPVDYLSQTESLRKGQRKEKVPEKSSSKNANPTHQIRAGESLEQKKERKAAVKREKREARKSKKEFKALYKSVSQHAQHAVAVTGPSAIHLA